MLPALRLVGRQDGEGLPWAAGDEGVWDALARLSPGCRRRWEGLRVRVLQLQQLQQYVCQRVHGTELGLPVAG